MVKPRQSELRTAKRRAGWSLAFCAASILLLASQGVESPRIAAQGQSTVEGTLEIEYEDSYAGARLNHFVNTGTERVPLRFAGRAPERLRTGARVRARGARRNGALMLAAGAEVASLNADGSTLSADASSPGLDVSPLGSGQSLQSTVQLASPNTFGAQSTLVILFNFSDLVTQPYTPASAQAVTFNEVSNFYLENSFGQTWLEGNVAGWFTIASPSTACNYNTWASQAEQAAINAGINLANYPRRVFGFPQTAACSWWGLGTVGGGTVANPSRAWINGPYSLRVVGHEMGHNLGLNHSRSSTCDSTGCVIDEYGDDHDIMGAVTGHFNAYQKERLGWLGSGSQPTIQAVIASGQYPLEPYATPNGGLPKALRIFKSTAGDATTYIYAEARTQAGSDSSLEPGVVIHTGVDNDGTQIYLHDLKPTTTVTDFVLSPGQSFTFSDAPITLTALSFDNSGAVLNVTVPCYFGLGASGQSFAAAGGSGTVALTTSSGCAWTATSNASWLTLNAGSASGTGPSTIAFTVAANTLASARTGTLTIGGQSFTVTQAGLTCNYAVSPTAPAFNYQALSNQTVSVTAPTGCSWTAISNVPSWITITAGASGTGNGSVTYSLASNSASHTSRSGTMTIAGQPVTVTQEGLAALFIFPTDGGVGVPTSQMYVWTSVSGASRYQLTIGTTPGGTDLLDTGEIGQTSFMVSNMPASRLLYARVRTKFISPSLAWTQSDIAFTTIDHVSSVQVVGAQTPNPLVHGQSAQYGAAAGTSVQIGFTGTSGLCTANLSATGLPTGASATFAPSSITSSATTQFSLMTIATTTATPAGTYSVTVTAQESGACGTGVTTTSVPLVVVNSQTATTLTPATTSATYGGTGTVSATLRASGTPISGKTIAFTLNGTAVGSTVTNGSGVATLNGVGLTGISAGSYPSGVGASFASDASYAASSGTAALTVNQKSVTPSITAANKTYSGTATATLTSCTVSGLVGGDVASCTGGTAAFASANVGVGQTVTASGLTLTGAAAANYTLSPTTATITASITALTVTPTVTVANKPYDGTLSATLTNCTLTGVIGGDAVNCTGGTAAFATTGVGAGKPVTVNGLTLTGAAAGNYVLSSTSTTTTAAITTATVTPTVVVPSKPYDGTVSATLTSCTLSGVIGGDVVNCTGGTAVFATASVGAGKTVTVSGLTLTGAAASSYVLSSTSATTTAAITGATVTPTVIVANKTYDGTLSASLTSCTLSGVFGGDVVSCTGGTAAFATTGVGAGKPVTVNGLTLTGAAAGNYALSSTSASTTAAITTATVTPTVVAGNKAYNGTVSATLTSCTLGGVIGADVVSCTGGTAAFATTSVGAGKPVTVNGLSLTGAAAGNYALSSTSASTTAAITTATVTPTVVVAGKAYDGTLSASLTSCTLSGVIGADVVSCTGGTAAFATTGVGAGKPVTVNGLSLTGAAAGNYALSSTSATTTATITTATVTPTVVAGTKAYDGLVSATLTSCTLAGAIGGDVVSCTGGTAAFATAGVGASKPVTVNGLSLTGTAAGNYALSSTSASTTAAITTATVTPTVSVASKPYDGLVSATLTSCTLGGVIAGDVLSCTGGTAAFATTGVGAGKPVTVNGLTLTGAAAGNYALSSTSASTTAAITTATVTPTVVVANKAYDGLVSATLTSCTLGGVIGADVVSCTGGTAAFATTGVGAGKPVTVNGLSLTGAAAGNYALSSTSATTTAAITTATVTPTVLVANKPYDGLVSASLTSCTLSGVIGADVVSCTGGTAAFATTGVGAGKPVTVNGLSLTGAAAGNYALSSTSATTTAAITTATVTPTVIVASKPYDGLVSASLTSCTLSGVIGADVVSCTGGTAAFATTGVGAGKPVTVNGLSLTGAAAGNYALSSTSAATTAAITTATVTPTVIVAGKPYDGTVSATLTSCTLSGVIGADVVSCTGGTAAFATTGVGAGKPVTVSGLSLAGAAAGNYALSSPSASTTAAITTATVTPSVVVASKPYDGLVSASLTSCSLSGVIGADVVSCTGGTAAFATTSVGAGKPVTVNGLTLTGAAASNYALSSTSATTTAAITTATVTPTVLVATKPYDGLVSASLTSCTLAGAIGADVVSCTGGTAAFATAGVGAGKPVTVSGLSLTGAAAGNYALSSTSASTTAAITAATVTPTVLVASKPYDGLVSATLTSCTLSGVLGSDVVSCTGGTAAFATTSVGAGKPVTVNGLTLTGAAAGNYALSSTSASTTAAITTATVTATVVAGNKAYDGTVSASLTSCTLAGVLGADVVSCTGGTAAFATAGVGAGKPVTVNGLSLTGAAAGNYALSSTSASTTAAITTATVTPTVLVASKPYDGLVSATLTSCTLAGAFGADVVNCTGGTAAFATAGVGAGKPVTVNGLTLTGAAAGNYALSSTSASTTAAITTATVTPTVLVASKPYDGLVSATLTSCTLSGVLGSDVVSCTGGTAAFATAGAGAGKTVTVSGLSLTGAAAGNYALSSTSATTTAAITAVTVTPTVIVANKLYDGLVSATLTSCTLAGVLGSDVVNCAGGTAAFATAGVGAGKTVTVSGLTLTGAAAGNYALSSTSATTTAAIATATVTPTVHVANKAYDGTPGATLTTCTLAGVLGSDVVNCAGGTAAFATAGVGAGKTVTASGLMLTGAAAGNYALSSTSATTTAAITTATVTPTVIVAGKPYDGTVSASLTSCTLTGVFGSDVVSCTGGTAAFATAGVGAGKTVTVSGLTLTGAAAGDYVLASTSATTTAAITGATVTPAVIVTNKTYDGTLSATLTSCTLTGVLGADVVSCTGGTAAFAMAGVGAGKPVTVSGLTLTGAAAGNYALSSTSVSTTAAITTATVTPTVIVASKPYDGLVSATLTSCTLAGAFGADVVSCTGGTAAFATAGVGAGKPVTVNGLTLTGAAAGNYALSTTTASATAAITTAMVTPTVVVANKAYDSTPSAALTSCTLTGVIGADVVSCTGGTAAFATAGAGAGKTVTVSGLTLTGAAAGNYALSSNSATTTAAITGATVTPAVIVSNKVYDGTLSAALTSCTLTGVIAGDVVSCTGGTAAFATAGAGAGKTVTVSGLTLTGAAAGDYILSSASATTTAAITGATVTPTVIVANKTYDGTASATLTTCTLTGAIAGDVVSCTGGTAAFATAGVGAGKPVTVSGLTLTGAAAGDYVLSSTSATTTAAITGATITPTVTVANKPYDGTLAATLTSCTLTGVVNGDAVSCAGGTAAFSTADVSVPGQTVTVSGLTLTGTAAGNYTLASTTATTTAAIFAATVTPAVTVANKPYDGTPHATLTSCTVAGAIGGDAVSCTGTAAFATAAVNVPGQTVTVSGLTLTGAAAGNYALSTTTTTATTTAAIFAATVTPVITVASKSYDGTTSAALTSCTLTGVVSGDVVSCTGTAGFATAGVSVSGQTVTATGLTLTGPGAGNYTLATTTATTTAAIFAATVTPAVAAANKPYDGTTHATITSCTVSGAVDGEVVSCTGGTAAFATVNVSVPGQTVTATGLTLSGAAAGNYTLSSTTATTMAAIFAATVTPAVTVANKTFDGTTSATLTGCTVTGAVGTDVVTCAGGTAAFDSPGAGLTKTATVSGLTLTGAAAGNYTLASTSATTTAAIAPLLVALEVTADDKQYDGTTHATLTSCTVGGVEEGNVVSCTGTATFDTANVGLEKTVTVSGLTLTGVAAGNYTLASAVAMTTAGITPVTVMPTVTAADKLYDGTPGATLTSCTASNVVAGDVVSCMGTLVFATVTFDTASIGVGKTVTASGLSLEGAAAGNYLLAATGATTTASIMPVTVTPNVTASSKLYDGTPEATLASCTVNGVIARDLVGCRGTAVFDTVGVGASQPVTVSGLALTGAVAADHYTLAWAASADPNVVGYIVYYGMAANAYTESVDVGSATTYTMGGLVVGQPYYFGVKAYDASGIESLFSNESTSAAAENYILSTTTATTAAAIAAVTVTPIVTVADKAYDGTMGATLTSCTVTGVIGSDVVGCTGTATFTSAGLGAGKAVAVGGLTLTGAAASNYTLATTTVATNAAITAASLTPAVTVANKAYDGTTSATLSGCTLTGVLGGDVVSCTGTASFATAGVGAGKTVTVSGLTLTGAAADKYTLASTGTTATAAIITATVTPTVAAMNKSYDGTPAAALISCTLSGVVVEDVVGCTGTATFVTAGAGAGKPVTVTNLALTGPDAANYSLAATSTTTTATINPLNVSALVTVADKTYDGTGSTTVTSCTLTGLVIGDVASCTGSGTFNTTSVGTGKTVTVGGLTLTGAAAGNYTLTTATATATAAIVAAAVSPSVSVANKTYDGSASATITSCTLSSLVGGDAVACTGTAAFVTVSAGTDKPVTVTSLQLTGTAAGNYTLAATTATTNAAIAPRTVTAIVTAADKLYDGTPGATLTSCTLDGLVSGDIVTCSGTAAFESASAGSAKTVRVTNLTLAGTAALNYRLAPAIDIEPLVSATTTAAIEARPVTAVVTGANKAYDGTTSATLASCTLTGVVGGDVVNCTGSATFDTASVGVGKPVTVSALTLTGAGAGNYTLATTTATGTGAITTASVTPVVTAANKVYDRTTSATFTSCMLTGVIGSDVVSCTGGTGAFATASVGAGKTVTASGLTLTGADAANYTLAAAATTTASITAASLTPAVTAANKVYNGTTSASLTSCTLTGVIGGDVVSCTGGTGAFATASVGASKIITASGLMLTGPDAGNYSLAATPATTTAAITAATVTPHVTAGNKIFDGTTTATLTSCTLTGLISGDVVTCSGSATFDTPSVGAGKIVTVSGLTLAGPAAGNYLLAATTATTAADVLIPPAPPATSLVGPIGSTTTQTPTFSWSAVASSTIYALSITDANTASPTVVWFTPEQAGCANGAGTCTAAAPRTLLAGLVTWKVITWNPSGYGPWSATATAVVDLADASVPRPTTGGPVGAISTRTPTYTWTAVAGAIWYQLFVQDVVGTVSEFWYTPAQACVSSSCAVTPNVLLPTGLANWKVKAWKTSGGGSWSDSVSFDAADIAPGKATLVSPVAPVTVTTPTFKWNAVIGASYYLLHITDRDNVAVERWYRPSDVGCPVGTGLCTASPGVVIKAGAASWKVLTWNGSGYGPWSDTRDFLVEIADPAAPTPTALGPTGAIVSANVSYRWTAVSGAISYRLSIQNNQGTPTFWWYAPAAAGCSATAECSASPLVALLDGTVKWQVQAWTTIGYGPWSSLVELTVNIPAPPAPTLVSPSGPAGSASPAFRWNAAPNATLYYIHVFDPTGLRVDKWLTPSQVGCASGGVCTLAAGVTLANGAGSWQVIAWNPAGYSPWSFTTTFIVP